jgi:rubrerythrin
MTNMGSVDEILDFAIKEEEEAAAFYSDLASKMESPAMRELFEQFAREEQGHKKKLLAIKENKSLMPGERKVLDLQLSDYLVETEVTPGMDYRDALVVAMKKEKAAFRLYTDLAATAEDEALRATLQALAQEEAKHKLRFEVEYDEYVMTEN